MKLATARTQTLEVSYFPEGPEDGKPLLLFHVWPEPARDWMRIAPRTRGCNSFSLGQ